MSEHNSMPPAEASTPALPVRLPPARVRTRPCPAEGPAPIAGQVPADPPQYTVGYRKPPKHTRFRPGQSGNPRGRPRSAKGLNTIVRETMTQKITVRTAAGEKKITRIEAVVQKTVEQAMKGNPRALAELLKLYGNAIPEERSEAEVLTEREEDLTATDLAILEALRAELLGETGDRP